MQNPPFLTSFQLQLPVFCEDVKKYYTEKEDEEMNNEDSKFPDHFDEISEDEVDDFTIHKTDSIIVCGTAQEDFSNLEIYIYDEENLNLYVHHDIVLSSYPLCIEWLPLKNNVKCNYALVGSFTPGIEIWNLDILDVLEPEVVLGKMNSKNKNFFLKIDKIIEKLKVKNENYKVYEKIKKQVINDEIIVDKAYDKLYSLKIINKK